MFDSNTPDEALMAYYQKGDITAFEELFRRHKRSVYSYIYRYTGNPEESEEVFQNVFIKLHRASKDYIPTAKFTTWLFTIVRNLCIDRHRKVRLRNNVSLDDYKDESSRSLHDVLASETPLPDSQSSDVEIGRILEEALNHINEDQKEVFLMREKSGLKFEEIAQVIGVSVNTVKSRMRYALENLKKYLEKSGLEDLNPNPERLENYKEK
jgi:RNA polymerase sigma-70 factor (ECF subfamily)